ncbi:protein-tyrosine-phosphatase [Rhizina undulata]
MSALDVPHDLVIPPLRFSIVEDKLYRGSYPRPLNFKFLESLRLKTILSLTPEPLIDSVQEWCRGLGIQMLHLPPSKPGKKGAPLEYSVARKAVEIMLDSTNAPLFVHCLNGSEVAGLAMASLRKLQFWQTPTIFSELMRFSENHRSFEVFLEEFNGEIEIPVQTVSWLWRGLKDEEGLGPMIHGVGYRYSDQRMEAKRKKEMQRLERLEMEAVDGDCDGDVDGVLNGVVENGKSGGNGK